MIINYTPKGDRDITQRELELEIGKDLENVPDIRYWFLDDNGLRAISLIVTGPEIGIVNQVANELALQMRRISLIANVTSETALDRPELRIQPRADLAARLGVSTEGLSETIRVATIGDVGPALAKFDAGDRQIPIRVQFDESARSELKILEQLRVPFGGGRGNVPLSVVADIRLDQGPTSINRYRPRTPGDGCRRPRRQGRARRRDGEDQRTAGDEEPAEGREGRPVRRRGKPAGACGRLRHRHQRRV